VLVTSYPNREPRTLSDSLRRKISADLKQDDSWVLWCYVERDGKRTKEPYQANRRRAKTDTPRTWATFEQVLEAYEQDDFFDGIGFVFHEGNPYAGGDIDDVTEEQAQGWLDRFDSYAERSPSGDGLHIIIKAKLPKGTNRRGRGELYSFGRFFTMTGDVVRDLPIREAQDAADEFYSYLRQNDQKTPERAPASFDSPELEDDEVLRLLENASNGHEFAMIYAGLEDFPSDSERDLSLAGRIAFYTQNERQVERIMRGSGCVREKWDRHHSYLKITIRKAISGLTNTYSPAGVTNIDTARVSKKAELQVGIRDLLRRWWAYDWSRVTGTEERPNWMRGHTCRDVMIALIDAAAKHGRIAGDTIEVSIGRRTLALLAATSTRTVHKAVKHLEAEGWLEFRPPDSENKPGTYVMRATLHQILSIHTRGVELEEKEGGGEDLRGRGVVPRLRWSAPYVPRLGKHNCAIIDRLLREGDMHVEELAEATNKRTRDLLARNLSKLQAAGIVELDGTTVRLADDWREALERRREEDGEIAAEKRDRKKYREQRENYRKRDKTPADEVPPLMGPERVQKIVEARNKEDLAARIEDQRRKVGITVETFIFDKLQALGQIRLALLMEVYEDAGGDPWDVPPAVRRMGCRVERLPEYENRQFVFPPVEGAA
jgi:putative DNA primase/helicase